MSKPNPNKIVKSLNDGSYTTEEVANIKRVAGRYHGNLTTAGAMCIEQSNGFGGFFDPTTEGLSTKEKLAVSQMQMQMLAHEMRSIAADMAVTYEGSRTVDFDFTTLSMGKGDGQDLMIWSLKNAISSPKKRHFGPAIDNNNLIEDMEFFDVTGADTFVEKQAMEEMSLEEILIDRFAREGMDVPPEIQDALDNQDWDEEDDEDDLL